MTRTLSLLFLFALSHVGLFGKAFHVYGHDLKYVRLAFGYPSVDEIETGIRILSDCVRNARV